jgi:ferric-dicitrate binding protein FerR (iron transport regulator)
VASTTAPLQDRPDPYAQITNPLNTGWGSTPPAPPRTPLATNPTPIRRRSPWLRRGVVLLVLAAIAGGLWWQRERVEDVVTDLRDRISEESAGPADLLEPDQG